jgi:prolipoprotein diacylglyceryltransferase
MIPYVHVSTLALGPLVLDPASVLSVVGLLIAIVISHRRARLLGLDARRLDSFLVWVLVGAFIGGHLSDALCYHFSQIADFSEGRLSWRDPWELFRVWHGWRSVGGFFGAILAGLLWGTHGFETTVWFRVGDIVEVEGYWFVRRQHRRAVLALADVVLSVFPIGWAFNRAGSALVHDHPGTRASAHAMLAVAYPDPAAIVFSGFGVIRGGVPRYDLGLLELLVTLLLVTAVLITMKRNVRAGTYICLVGLVYAPARFALDFLCRRTGDTPDPHYGTLTPAQWGFAGLFLLSALVLLRNWTGPYNRPSPA